MQAINFEEVLEQILARDKRYHREAYFFVREGLDYTQKKAIRSNKNEIRHISGQELLEGLREYGISQYGPLACTLLQEWGILKGEDFGEIVFNMVEHGLLSKTEQDSREDFKGGYNFDEAFRTPFLPAAKKKSRPPPEPSQSKI
jgi:uncharacterized repeat protein (TIGR04138 family)